MARPKFQPKPRFQTRDKAIAARQGVRSSWGVRASDRRTRGLAIAEIRFASAEGVKRVVDVRPITGDGTRYPRALPHRFQPVNWPIDRTYGPTVKDAPAVVLSIKRANQPQGVCGPASAQWREAHARKARKAENQPSQADSRAAAK